MSARAFVLGRGQGSAPPPAIGPSGGDVATLIWDEPFNQADVDTFLTQYNTNDAIGWDPDDVTSGRLSLSSGTMQIAQGALADVTFGPDAFTPVRELWLRILFSITGGDYPVGAGDPCFFRLWGDDTDFSNYCDWSSQFFSGSTVDQTYGDTAWGDVQDTEMTSLLYYLPEGAYEFVACISEPTAGVLQHEVWVNPTTGDPPLVVATSGRNESGMLSRLRIGFGGPTPSGTAGTSGPRVLVADRCTLWGGTRPSDPVGIL